MLKNLALSGSKPKKRHFLITSHGQTASLWLAAVINKHPKIFCTHAYSYPPKGAEARELTAAEASERQASAGRFWKLSLRQYFRELELATDKMIVGSVHSYTLGHLLNQLPWYARQHLLNPLLMNMVRHPITRLTSTFTCWTNPERKDYLVPFVAQDFQKRCHHLIHFISQKYQVNYTAWDKTFVVALLSLEDITKDVRIAHHYKIPNISYEQVTKNPEYLKEKIQYLLADEPLENDIFNEMITLKSVNKHNHRQASDPMSQYQQWEDWQKSAFQFIFERQQMQKTYAEFEYDFSFL